MRSCQSAATWLRPLAAGDILSRDVVQHVNPALVENLFLEAAGYRLVGLLL